ncbi:MAG: acetyl-CoA carboxylase biotin carboxyl carrier protein subunit [Robiginitalea sp.]
MPSSFKIDVNDAWSFDMDHETLQSYDMVRLSTQTLHVLKGRKPFKAAILHSDFLNRSYEVQVNGNLYSVRLSDELDQLIAQMGFELGSASAISQVEAPMPGLILDIQVAVGQKVTEGDALLVLEAMKMENLILSPRDGVIKKIAVTEGTAVDKKDLLIEFE